MNNRITRMHSDAADIQCAELTLSAFAAGTKRLSDTQLEQYSNRSVIAGWRLPVEFENGNVLRLDILLRIGGARRIPLVALVDRPDFLTWPHIESDGIICLKNDNPAFEVGNLPYLIQHQVSAAVKLVTECKANEREQDFRDEARSYWAQRCTKDTRPIHSLLNPLGPSRLVNTWYGQSRIICAESSTQLCSWLEHKTGKSEKWKTQKELFLWLDAPLLPAEFPETAQDILRLIEINAPELVEEFCNILRDRQGFATVFIGAPTESGAFMGAVLVPRMTSRGKGRHHGDNIPGFRAGKEPVAIVKNHYLGTRTAILSTVKRADAQWVHGRDHNHTLDELQNCTVVIIGCGSVGAHLAEFLAQAGIPNFHLIDGDSLEPENTSRHPLGAEFINRNKAAALATHLKSRLPHIVEITAYRKRWEQLNESEFSAISQADLVISAIGDIGSELSLCAALRESENPPHMLFTWLGGYAMTGYSLAIGPDGPCLRCSIDNLGMQKITAVDFGNDTTTKTEPACGNTFQPYGIVELVTAVSEMADLALSLLLGNRATPILRIQVQKEERVLATGGKWSEIWVETTGRTDGGFIWEGEVNIDPNCPEQH